MLAIFIITGCVIMLYMLYPLWLMLIAPGKSKIISDTDEIDRVSVILLSFNGKAYLEDKINFLVREMGGFKYHELIIIDDHSEDGSDKVLDKFRENGNIKILHNSRQEGIPFCMNLGVATANYDFLVFCDQRQELSDCSLKKIVEPLRYPEIGAVSGCISSYDRGKKCSLLRRHENALKLKESATGNLIGVYGPFYAIKKQFYSQIPGHIILDDLYLSLKILKSKQIMLSQDCKITDESFSILYNYKRTRRYLKGLLQILKERSMIKDLNYKQLTMLIWHKYLRLIIPALLFLCYVSLGLAITSGIEYLIAFGSITVAAILSVLPGRFMCRFRLKNLIRMNVLYFLALLDIIINGTYKHRAP